MVAPDWPEVPLLTVENSPDNRGRSSEFFSKTIPICLLTQSTNNTRITTMSLFRTRPIHRPIVLATRQYSTQSPSLPSRWFTDVRAQLTELTAEKYPKECVQEAKKLYDYSEKNWLELLAGQQGFLTEKNWRGIDNHPLLWGDMDSMGHVNNVMYNKYAETGRVQFTHNHAEHATGEEKQQWLDLVTPKNLGLILKSIKTEYKFPLEYPDRITIVYKLLEAPTHKSTSLKKEAWILSEKYKRLAAKCIEDTAIYDYTVAKKSVLKPFMVEKFQQTFKLQQDRQKTYSEEANKLLKAAEELKAKYQ
ncbi:thioesterase-like superfamily-domain-containing protein [Fusarium flagelliforme]|uniref:thioesterase-like superfamily-domain-containing protein n=1 Tax=Fusarium flagelliforme TaxID=2675880 RepID=UPI001E8ED201|nr:thioesterase-like superfamily-domain-containing protein [Fusarium flagelliforme]KAH7179050.1 thioesterase-like superfamily-domain-containing protein [Fusarium flagelliforme]